MFLSSKINVIKKLSNDLLTNFYSLNSSPKEFQKKIVINPKTIQNDTPITLTRFTRYDSVLFRNTNGAILLASLRGYVIILTDKMDS